MPPQRRSKNILALSCYRRVALPGSSTVCRFAANLETFGGKFHGNDQGLGEAILKSYDGIAFPVADAKSRSGGSKEGAKGFPAFTLRRLDGTLLPLAQLKEKSWS